MDVNEALDREVIVERAEALRIWLEGLSLSPRAKSALDRELSGIIANDPGGYINGARPLAGMSNEAFIAELQRPNGGAVGKVRGVDDGIIGELRAALIPAEDGYANGPASADEPAVVAPRPARTRARNASRPAPAEPAVAAEAPRRRGRARATPAAEEATFVEAPPAEPAVTAEAPRRRGRPRATAAAEEDETAPVTAETPRRRGRPRATPAPLADGQMADEVPAAEATLVEVPPVASAVTADEPAEEAAPAEAAPLEPAVTAEAPRRGRGRPRATPVAEAAEAAPVMAEAPRRRGRPRATPVTEEAEPAVTAEAPRRRGRPRATPATKVPEPVAGPAPTLAASPGGDLASSGDPLLEQLTRLWPLLHPQARRAIVLYTSSLLIEG